MINGFNKDDKKQIRQIKNNIINFNSIINNTVGNENKIENTKNLLDNSLEKLLHVYEKNGISIVDMIKTLKSNSDDLKVNKDILKELVCSKQLDEFIKDGIDDYVSTKIDNLEELYDEYSSLKDSIDFSKIELEKIEETDNPIPNHPYEEFAKIFINNKDDIDWNNPEHLFALEDVIVNMQNKNKKIQEAISINPEIGHVDEDNKMNIPNRSNTDDEGLSVNSFFENSFLGEEDKQFVLTTMLENQGTMIDALQNELNEQMTQNTHLQETITDLQETITDLNAQRAQQKKQNKDKNKYIKNKENVINKLSENNKKLTKRNTSYRKENNYLRNKVAEQGEYISNLENMVAQEGEHINNLENTVDEQANQIKTLEGQNNAHISELQSKNDMSNTLRNEIVNLKQQIDDKDRKINKLERMIKDIFLMTQRVAPINRPDGKDKELAYGHNSTDQLDYIKRCMNELLEKIENLENNVGKISSENKLSERKLKARINFLEIENARKGDALKNKDNAIRALGEMKRMRDDEVRDLKEENDVGNKLIGKQAFLLNNVSNSKFRQQVYSLRKCFSDPELYLKTDLKDNKTIKVDINHKLI